MKSWLSGIVQLLGTGVLILAMLLRPMPVSVRSAALQIIAVADSGPGTLRQALLDAQSGDTITFSPAVFPPGSPTTIWVRSALPTLARNNVTLDASNAGVTLEGWTAGTGVNGLTITASGCKVQGLTIQHFSGNGISIGPGASGCMIGGNRNLGTGPNGQGNLVSGNYATGIEINGAGADGNLVQGNYIGIDQSGTFAMGNTLSGVAIWYGARGNIIGGAASGYRNVISGNGQNGVWIGGAGTDQNVVVGNYVGTRADGLGPVGNRLSGVSIPIEAQDNRIGGTTAGEGNLISGNQDYGIYISDSGTSGNQILGNIIGPNRDGTTVIGQGNAGVLIRAGASNTKIGNGSVAGRNLISGNTADGVRIEGSDTMSNTVQGNYIGTNISGTLALPNGVHGVELTQGTHHNLIGGDRLAGQGNLVSGNRNHGLVMTSDAHHNTFSGNLVGPDATGTVSLGYHPYGGVDITDGAHDNMIGGLAAGAGNVISGNPTDGIALFDNTGRGTIGNQIVGNLIGLTLDGSHALPNGGPGIFNVLGAVGTRIEANTISGNAGNGVQLSGGTNMSGTVLSNRIGTDLTGTLAIPNGGAGVLISEGSKGNLVQNNTIAFNQGDGITVTTCYSNTLTQNSIYSNALTGIASVCVPAPAITGVALGATESVTGTAIPNARVEFFSDDGEQGRTYEGSVQADSAGNFTFSKAGGFAGPNLTATSTDSSGNTSGFSPSTHLLWTVLLYLNGDNDLENDLRDMLGNLVAAGLSPRANVLALLDGYTTSTVYSGTLLYDVTRGQATPIAATLDTTLTVPGELNMGDGHTLASFVIWGRSHYPARHTLLAIVDHGGGWAPSLGGPISGTLPHHDRWMAGGSGLSWDWTSDYDYLDSQEMRQTMATITQNGADPLDVVFYDVCLMGMVEVAYQIKDYASFFVSSQNIGWAPIGPQGRYVQLIHGITSTTTPRDMAGLLVAAYANSMPPDEHPFTISAVDLAQLPAVTGAINQLGLAISQTLADPQQAEVLHRVYTETQKVDYNADFSIDPDTDGFVDLYDLAVRASQWYTEPDIVAGANAMTTSLNSAIVAEQHRSGSPWMARDRVWNLDNVHGLSIYLPLGQDLVLPFTVTSPITPSLVLTRYNVLLRDTYSSDQLQFVAATAWKGLIDSYYTAVSTPVPTQTTQGPVGTLLTPDVTPPQTIITLTGAIALGQTITVTWTTTDTQSGPGSTTLWHWPPFGPWTSVLTQTGSSGVFSFPLSPPCTHGFAVRSTDQAGNLEPFSPGSNMFMVDVPSCYYLPLIFRNP